MKLVRSCPGVVGAVVSDLATPFTLIDVGCAYGVDPPFHDFGEKLRAFGFEPNIDECKRLNAANRNPAIQYFPAFVKLKPTHPFAVEKSGKSHWSNNPWDHLAVAHTLKSMPVERLDGSEKIALNLWADSQLAAAGNDIYLDRFLPEHGVNAIDLCKIDVDGADFEILHSLESFFLNKKALAIVIEVNYFGSDNNTDHTFHNVDRYLRRHGFDLYGLTVNKYAARSLPSPYYFAGPGENMTGRPYQGDALYVLDIFSQPTQLSKDELLKLVAIFALFDLPDWAAETLQLYGHQHLSSDKISQFLELLAAQIQEHQVDQSRYADYIAAFERNSPLFYPAASGQIHDTSSLSLRDELTRLRAEVRSIKNSNSWRITAPLRKLSQFLRGKISPGK